STPPLPHELIHLTRGPKDKDAIRSSTSSSSSINSTYSTSSSCDHKVQGAGPRVPSSTSNCLPDALRTIIRPDSSSSTEYAHSHLRVGPSSASSSHEKNSPSSLSSALSLSALVSRPSDLGIREKAANNKTITGRGEYGGEMSRAADGQRGTQRHPHVHRTSRATSLSFTANQPVVPLSRQGEYCRPASSSTATPPSRKHQTFFFSSNLLLVLLPHIFTIPFV
ncbi:4645_t:CDS:1, partial [Acaulospora colombiana]